MTPIGPGNRSFPPSASLPHADRTSPRSLGRLFDLKRQEALLKLEIAVKKLKDELSGKTGAKSLKTPSKGSPVTVLAAGLPGRRYAVLAWPDGRRIRVHQGETLPDGERIERIDGSGVTIRKRSSVVVYPFGEAGGSGGDHFPAISRGGPFIPPPLPSYGAPRPMSRNRLEKKPPEILSDPDGTVSAPESLRNDLVAFDSGQILVRDELRGRRDVDDYISRVSEYFESSGKLSALDVAYVPERILSDLFRTLRKEEEGTDAWTGNEFADAFDPVPETPLKTEDAGEVSGSSPSSSGELQGLPVDQEPEPKGASSEESAPAVRNDPPREPSDPEFECLSSPGRNTTPIFLASAEIAPMVLLISDGRFYVSREHRDNQHVNYYSRHFVPELWSKVYPDRPIPRPQFVSYETLRKIRRDTFPEEQANGDLQASGDEARKVLEIIRDAVVRKASDIHVRIEKDRTRILYRVHGWLKPVQTLTHDEGERLARIVYNTMLDSSGRDTMFSDKKPQDGQFRQDYLPRGIFNIREFHAPTLGAGLGTVTMVLRLQYGSGGEAAEVTDIDTLGYDARQLAQIRFLMGLSHGIILFAGPMGSGKKHHHGLGARDRPGHESGGGRSGIAPRHPGRSSGIRHSDRQPDRRPGRKILGSSGTHHALRREHPDDRGDPGRGHGGEGDRGGHERARGLFDRPHE